MAPRKKRGANSIGIPQTASSSSQQNKQSRKAPVSASTALNNRARTNGNCQIVLQGDDVAVSSNSKQSKQSKSTPVKRSKQMKSTARGKKDCIDEVILLDEDSRGSSSSKNLSAKPSIVDSVKETATEEESFNFFLESSSDEDELLSSPVTDILQSSSTGNKENNLRELNQRQQSSGTAFSDSDCSVTALEFNDQPENKKNNRFNILSSRVSQQKPVALDLSSRDDVVLVDVDEENASCAPSTSNKKSTAKKRLVLTEAEIQELHSIPVVPSARIFSSCIEEYHKETFEDYLKAQGIQDNDDATEKEPVDDNVQEKKAVEYVISRAVEAKVNKLKKTVEKERRERVRRLQNVLAASNSLINAELEKEEIELICVVEQPVNKMFDVRVTYQNQTTKFLLKRDEQFTPVFMQLSKIHNLDISRIMLYVREEIIYPEDTPEKAKLKDIDNIECLLYAPGDEKNNKNWINVKIQSNDIREKQVLPMHKLQPFVELMKQYSKNRGIPMEKMVFSFDGEKIDPTHHSLDLTLENNDVVDVKIL